MSTIFNLPQSEEAAVAFFQEKGILPQHQTCPSGHSMSIYFGDRIFWKCNKNSCRQCVGLRVGNWFESTRLPFLTAVRLIYSWAFELTSMEWCKRELKIDTTTAVQWNSFMREAVGEHLAKHKNLKIGGEGHIVEIDESMFTRRKNHAGRIFPQQWIFGGLCRDIGECFLVKVPDRSAETLVAAIKSNVASGSTIYTDCWRGYSTRELEQAGYTHLTVNHKFHFLDPESGVHTQNIERLWGSAKWRNKRHRGTARQNLGSYLIEFMWRQHIKTANPFEAALEAIAEFWPPAEKMEVSENE